MDKGRLHFQGTPIKAPLCAGWRRWTFFRSVLLEAETGTGSLIFSTVSAEREVLLVRCLLVEAGAALNIFLLGLVIPSVGMALGALTRTPRVFELVACTLACPTYEHAHMIDVLGMTSSQRWIHAALGTLALAALVPLWRRLRTSAG